MAIQANVRSTAQRLGRTWKPRCPGRLRGDVDVAAEGVGGPNQPGSSIDGGLNGDIGRWRCHGEGHRAGAVRRSEPTSSGPPASRSGSRSIHRSRIVGPTAPPTAREGPDAGVERLPPQLHYGRAPRRCSCGVDRDRQPLATVRRDQLNHGEVLIRRLGSTAADLPARASTGRAPAGVRSGAPTPGVSRSVRGRSPGSPKVATIREARAHRARTTRIR